MVDLDSWLVFPGRNRSAVRRITSTTAPSAVACAADAGPELWDARREVSGAPPGFFE